MAQSCTRCCSRLRDAGGGEKPAGRMTTTCLWAALGPSLQLLGRWGAVKGGFLPRDGPGLCVGLAAAVGGGSPGGRKLGV